MAAEFLVWKYRPALLFTMLFFVICKMHSTSTNSNVALIGKLYPRGNHWAVGHLMGKKSTGSVESQRIIYQPGHSPEEDKLLGRYSQPSSLVRGLIGVLTGEDRQKKVTPHRELALNRKREWEKRQERQHYGRAFSMKDRNFY